MTYSYSRPRTNEFSEEYMLSELERVSEVLGYREFGWREFNKYSKISANPVKKHIGWKNAINILRARLKEKGITLKQPTIPSNRIYSDRDLFAEMGRVWDELGHRPSRSEWEMLNPKIHYNTYKSRFGGWQNACLKFIEYKMGSTFEDDDNVISPKEVVIKVIKTKKFNTRAIPLNIRLKVLNRDSFRCVFCGRSPATDIGVKLHLDHIKPFSQGGGNTEDNLQTLCQDCNLGKSDNTNI